MANVEYHRWAAESVRKTLEVFRLVFIAGSRQCGKTTLTHQLDLPSIEFRSLDSSAQYQVAQEDPAGFVERHGSRLMVIDEIQKVPSLLPEIKRTVDEDKAKGQYLLTGSADIRKLPAITESLAGRMGTFRLRPLAHGEIAGNQPTFLRRVAAGDFPTNVEGYSKRNVIAHAFVGGYGETLDMALSAKRQWFNSYLDALLLHDVRELMDVRDYQTLRKLMVALLSWSTKLFTEVEFTRALGIKHETFVRFLSILQTMYLLDEVPAWHRGDYAGICKRSKFIVADTGMMASLLNWREDEVFLDSDRSGKLIETWVYNQLAAQMDLDLDFSICHYRDSQKREIDFILEASDGRTIGIEVKAGSDVGVSDFKHLIWFRDHCAEDGRFNGIVLYTGTKTLPFGKGLYAVPIGAVCA